MSNKKVLKKTENINKLLSNNQEEIFMENVMRKESLEKLIFTRHTEGNKRKEKRHKRIVKGQKLLKEIQARKLWRAINTHVLIGHCWQHFICKMHTFQGLISAVYFNF